jgi:ADP-dependent NAD(P)H-hydrate dehydratase
MEELLRKLERKSDSRKGENGKVGVIAGSRDYTGAPALSAKAALRTGSDLVKILTSEEISDTVAGYSENFIVEDYSGGYFGESAVDQALELDEWADVIVVGPGLSDLDEIALQEFLEMADATLVVDADAIKPAANAEIKAIYTPHRGELEFILDRYDSEEDFVCETGSVLAVKGKRDRVYSDEKDVEIEAGTSAMTVGGTGDVLTGVVASLISQDLNSPEASRLGLRINGKAGVEAEKEFGNGLLATDLIEKIPEVIREN